MDRRKLEADPCVRRSFLEKLQQALEVQVEPLLQSEHVWLLLSAMSVVVHVHLRPPLGTSVDEVMALLAEPARLAREAAGRVASVEGIEAVATVESPGCDLSGTNTVQVSKPRVVPRAMSLRCSHMPKVQHRRRRDGLCCGCGYIAASTGGQGSLVERLLAWLLGGAQGARWFPGLGWLLSAISDAAGETADDIATGLSAMLRSPCGGDRYVRSLNDASWHERKAEVLYDFDSLEHIGVMGTGNFGTVTLVRCPKTLNCFAMKAMSKASILKHQMYHCVKAEKQVMGESCNRFIIQLFASFSRNDYIYLLMEPAMGGDLFSVYRAHELFGGEEHARFYTACIVRALEHLHGLRVIYRDLKMENVVIDVRGYGKLCDFGMAKMVVWPSRTYTICGTLEYLAPEILTGWGYSYPVDWWALGIMVCEMIAGETPFEANSVSEVHRRLMAGMEKIRFQTEAPWTDLVRGLCQRIPEGRLPMQGLGIREIERHPWYLEVDFGWTDHARQEMPSPHVPTLDGDSDLRNFDVTDHRPPLVVDAIRDNNEWAHDFEAPWGPLPAAKASE
jgi:cGMP-dependent protein kinase